MYDEAREIIGTMLDHLEGAKHIKVLMKKRAKGENLLKLTQLDKIVKLKQM